MAMPVRSGVPAATSGLSTDPSVLAQQKQILELQRQVLELQLQNQRLQQTEPAMAMPPMQDLITGMHVKKAASGSDKVALFRLQLEDLTKKETALNSQLSDYQRFISGARQGGIDAVIAAIDGKTKELKDRLNSLESGGDACFRLQFFSGTRKGYNRKGGHMNVQRSEAEIQEDKTRVIAELRAWEQMDYGHVSTIQFSHNGNQTLKSEHLEWVVRYNKAKNTLTELEAAKNALQAQRKRVEEQMEIFLKQ